MKYEPIVSDSFYHIYNCGNNKEDIFVEDRNYKYFLELVKKYVIPIADIWSYCLLKNHFHLLIRTKEDVESKKLSQGISNLFNTYAKSFNKAYRRTGSLFKDRFSRIKIEKESYLKTVIIYINTNAVHHGFVERVEDYEHSSYKALISDKETLLKRKCVIELFGEKENFKFVIKRKQTIIGELALE